MSDPKRGMVAGCAIQTQPQTKEFDEGYERTFGAGRKAQRGRFVWDKERKELVQVDADWTGAESRARTPTEELVYGNALATDGTPINSKRKHREYLKQNGLAMAGDFSPQYQEREARNREWKEDSARREQISRDVYKIFPG